MKRKERRISARPVLVLALAALAARCGPPTIAPVSAADPGSSTCPGGKNAWSLEVLDRRVDREASERVVALLRDSIVKSFPACKWSAAPDPSLPSVSIEINRFRAPFEEGMWNGVADWNVLARDSAGRSLTEFDAVSEVARPNYQGSNNEKEAMTQVYREALEKTLSGLRAVPPIQ